MRTRTIGLSAVAVASSLAAALPAAAQLLGGGHRDAPEPQAFRDCAICPEMLVVPPGSFEMGAAAADVDAYDNELPRHQVTIAEPFAIGMMEITFAQWDACVAHNGCEHRPGDQGWGRGDMPVMDVSWNDAVEYVVWLSGFTGRPYRLPTEAEWEYAARANARGPYFWGSDPSAACAYANVADQAAAREYPEWEVLSCDDGFVYNSPAGSFRPNNLGLHDTLGNVWEWVEDCWNPNYNGAPADGSSWGAGDCRRRVLRGGAATGLPREARLSQRGVNDPEVRAVYNGFRVVVPLDAR